MRSHSNCTASGMGGEIWLLDLDEMAEPLLALEQHTPLLPPCERVRLEGGGIDKRRRIIANIALRQLIARCAGAEAAALPFTIGTRGRPDLAVPLAQPGLSFSLSHSHAHGLIVLSRCGTVGADLQNIVPRTVAGDRRARLEEFGEGLGLQPLPSVGSDARLIAAWCRIEAVAKASGLGVGALLQRAGISGAGSRSASRSSVLEAAKDQPFRAWDVPLDPASQFRAAIALPGGDGAEKPAWLQPRPVSVALLQSGDAAS